jgi:uncharacterized protein
VAGPADIDKLDYLLRDSHYCGVEYGRYDLFKLVESARCISDAGGTYLGFDEGGVYALEEMLLARYHMHRQVYGHRTRVATDRMLVRAIELGIADDVLPVAIFHPPAEPDRAFVEEYLKWDDAEITRALCARRDTPGGQVMHALTRRHLFKQELQFSLPELIQRFGRLLGGSIANPDSAALAAGLQAAEASIAAAAGIDPQWVSLHWENRTSPIWMRDDPKLPESGILMVNAAGGTDSFVDRSEVFQAGSRSPEPSVVLYVRPPGDAHLEEAVREQVRTVTLGELEGIGNATLSI